MVDLRGPQRTLEFRDELEVTFDVLVGCHGSQEIARIGQPIRADRPEFGQPQQGAEVFADVTPRRTVRQVDAETHTTWNDRDFLRLDLQHAKFGRNAQTALLRDYQQLGVGVVEEAALHRTVRGVDVDAAPTLRGGAAVAGDREQPVDEIGRRVRQRERIPAQLVRGNRHLVAAVVEARSIKRFERAVDGRRTDPVQPTAPINMPRRGKRGAGQLFSVKAVRDALRRILAAWQSAGQRFGRKFVAETGLITHIHRRRHVLETLVCHVHLSRFFDFALGAVNCPEPVEGLGANG